MDEHLKHSAMVELVNRTQSMVLALACSFELLDEAEDMDDLLRRAKQLKPGTVPDDPKHLSVALSACFESWILAGHYSRPQLMETALRLIERLAPKLPKGPVRGIEDAP